MSRPRYAPITSELLVRKGAARAWDIPDTGALDFAPPAEALAELPRNTLEREDEERIAVEYEKWMRERDIPPSRANRHTPMHGARGDESVKRCTIRLSHDEYERLNIVAAKREITRADAVREAIDRYLAAAKRQYKSQCSCLGSGPCEENC